MPPATRFDSSLTQENSSSRREKKPHPLDDPAFRTPDLALDSIDDHRSIGFNTTNVRQPNGGAYSVNTDKEECYRELRDARISCTGRLSPASKVTLQGDDKQAADIPADAMHFAFAYPIAFEGDEKDLEGISPQSLADPKLALLALGGFVYWDANWVVCGIKALKAGAQDRSNLCFKQPKPLSKLASGAGELLRSSLYDNDRIEQVTIQALRVRGVSGFCWLAPNERFPGQDMARKHPWPDGAFAYFFDDAVEGDHDYFCKILSQKDKDKYAALPRQEHEAAVRFAKSPTKEPSSGEAPGEPAGQFRSALARCGQVFTPSQHQLDFVRKAETHCLLKRAVAEVWTVRVKGSLDNNARGEWYRHVDEVDYRPNGDMFVRLEGGIDIKEDGSVWRRVAQDGVKLELIRATPVPGRRLETHSARRADGREGRLVMRNARHWRKLRPADLDEKAEGVILHPSESLLQLQTAWYLTPMQAEIEREGPIEPPDASGGKLMNLVLRMLRRSRLAARVLPLSTAPSLAHRACLAAPRVQVLPFSFLKTTLVSLNVGKLTDFSMLGIGVETYFAQLVSLGFVFLLMGCASLGNILTNLNQEPPPGAASSYQFSDFLISTSLGARSTSSNADWVFQSSNAELAGTLIFIVYTPTSLPTPLPHPPPPPPSPPPSPGTSSGYAASTCSARR